jgi:hypothetical protein
MRGVDAQATRGMVRCAISELAAALVSGAS